MLSSFVLGVSMSVLFDQACKALDEDPKSLNEFLSETTFSKVEKQTLCLIAVKGYWPNIYTIPEELIYDDLIIACLEQSFSYVEEMSPGHLTPKIIDVVKERVQELEFLPYWLRTPDICLNAVKKNWQNVSMVPGGMLYEEVHIEAVNKNWRAFFYLKQEAKDNPLVIAAFKQSWTQLNLVLPEPFSPQNIHSFAIEQDASLLEWIPPEFCNPELFIHAVKKNPEHLRYVPRGMMFKVGVEWVKSEAIAIGYLPSALRQKIIDAIGPEELLLKDFMVAPLLFEYEAYHLIIEQLLARCEHLVVTKPQALQEDAEIRDSYLVYANASKRVGKTLHVDANFLSNCLDLLATNKNLNLVVLGHDPFFVGQRKLGGLSNLEIVQTLKSNANISRLTLLTCNSAKANLLDKEKEINQRLIARRSQNKPSEVVALILMSSLPENGHYKKIYESLNCEEMFVWVQETSNQVLLFQNKRGEQLQRILSDEESKKLHRAIYPNGKKIPFPKKEGTLTCIRGREEKLSQKEYIALTRIITQENPYSKTHPEYRNNKQIYCFFNNVQIDEGEYKKLKPCLLKDIIDLVQLAKLSQTVHVKAYNNVLHVHTQEKRFVSAVKTANYERDYKEKNRSLFFSGIKGSVNTDALDAEMDKMVNKILERAGDISPNPSQEEPSQVKAITYKIKAERGT